MALCTFDTTTHYDTGYANRGAAVGAMKPFLAATDWHAAPDEEPGPFLPFAVARASHTIGRSSLRGIARWDRASRHVGETRWADALGVAFHGSYGFGILCSLLTDAGYDTRQSRLLLKMRRHLTTTVHARLSEICSDNADAIITPDGRLLHAETAFAKKSRQVLAAAVRELEASRRDVDQGPEGEALWRELIAGEWSVIERIERDGKRYLLLARAEAHPRLALMDKDARILELVDEGRSNKHIAIELGLAESTVSERLAEVFRKLQFRNRTDYLSYIKPSRRG